MPVSYECMKSSQDGEKKRDKIKNSLKTAYFCKKSFPTKASNCSKGCPIHKMFINVNLKKKIIKQSETKKNQFRSFLVHFKHFDANVEL